MHVILVFLFLTLKEYKEYKGWTIEQDANFPKD